MMSFSLRFPLQVFTPLYVFTLQRSSEVVYPRWVLWARLAQARCPSWAGP